MSGSIFSRARAKPYHHGDLRRALLDATLQLIEEQGPQGFTLRAAARRAGVTAGATYHHFKDKEDLVAAVAEEGFQLLRKELIEAADKPCDSARDRSRNVAVAYVSGMGCSRATAPKASATRRSTPTAWCATS
jgi:AcrR family transcriptional regulator